MTRRLVYAIIGVTAVALLATWLGLVVLSRGAARDRSADELVEQGLVALESLDVDAARDSEAELAPLVALLKLDDATVLTVEQSGELAGRLPDALRPADLDPESLIAGTGRSGARGDDVFVALPKSAADGEVAVLVLTRTADPPPGVLPSWLALTTIVALAIGVAVAVEIAGRMTKPVVDAAEVAARIAAGERGVRLTEPPPGASDELAELTRSINEMATTIERSSELERQFLMSISHDLRTPLTSIRGYAEAIETGAINDIPWATSVIKRESDRLDRLVRDLLDLARLDAQSFTLQVERCDLADCARTSVDMLSYAAQDAGLHLSTGELQTCTAVADPDRLAQLIGNLVDNALKFAESRIEVSVVAASDRGEIRVDDDGPGVDTEERPFVFERHFTTDRQQRRGSEGTGLGLALVAQLASAMGGEASVHESPAGGARFVVSLPAVAT
jgi:signal transduction histidine kinase